MKFRNLGANMVSKKNICLTLHIFRKRHWEIIHTFIRMFSIAYKILQIIGFFQVKIRICFFLEILAFLSIKLAII